MKLHERIAAIQNKQDLADFVGALRADLETNKESWENPNLDMFLEAMQAWIESCDNIYKNTDQPIPENPTWMMFAKILYAAKIYE